MSKVKVTPMPLYKNIAGRSLFENREPAYMEYRRRWSQQPRDFYTGDFPLFIDIEVTNACNLRCTFCATTYLDAKRQYILPELVYKILDEGKKNCLYGVKFNDRGEPLLHSNLTDFIKYAKEIGLIDVYFNTNAVLLTEDKIEGIIDSGLDRISISIEGYDAEFYESHRINSRFNLVVKNVQNLMRIRNAKKAKNPLIRIQSILLPDTRNNLDEYLEKYKIFWAPYSDEIAVLEYKEESSAAIQYFEYPWACHQLWQRMIVWCDGKIFPCNEDNQGLMVLGNVCTMSIKEAWHCAALNNLRKIHKQGKSHFSSACNKCYLRSTQIKKLIKTENQES